MVATPLPYEHNEEERDQAYVTVVGWPCFLEFGHDFYSLMAVQCKYSIDSQNGFANLIQSSSKEQP